VQTSGKEYAILQDVISVPPKLRKTTMKIKYALCGIVLALVVTPALAASKFYVVRDTTTNMCSIVEQKPTEATMKLVGMAHKTQAKAEKAMKGAKICEIK
jgi:hypothetical protein